jgi:hypothetical protein
MTKVVLRVDADADASRLHQLTSVLFNDVRALGSVTVAKAAGEAPDNAKSATGNTIAELVITGLLSASTVGAVRDVITAYIKRTGARSVIWRDGKHEVVFTGIAADDERVLAQLLARTAPAPQPDQADDETIR